MTFNFRTLFFFIFLVSVAPQIAAQRTFYLKYELAPRFIASYQNPATSLQFPNKECLYGNRISLTGQTGFDFGWTKSNHRGWELGIHYGISAAKAYINSPRSKKGFGHLRAYISQFEFPLRYQFPIYTNTTKISNKDSKLKYLTGTIGVQYAVLAVNNPDISVKEKKARDGSNQNLQYKMDRNRENLFGATALEFGIGNTWQLRKKTLIYVNMRATIGINPVAAYEVEWYASPEVSGTSNILIKNDGLSLNFSFLHNL
jgi:hypothetical protein